jgi:uncharacterized OB-fold protein
MSPSLPEPIRLSRERQEKRAKLAGLRPGWLCPKCGGAHGPTVETCPEGKRPIREVIR